MLLTVEVDGDICEMMLTNDFCISNMILGAIIMIDIIMNGTSSKKEPMKVLASVDSVVDCGTTKVAVSIDTIEARTNGRSTDRDLLRLALSKRSL